MICVEVTYNGNAFLKASTNHFFLAPQAARIIAKLAAWGRDLMEGSDLNYYFNWIKTQLSSQVKNRKFHSTKLSVLLCPDY